MQKMFLYYKYNIRQQYLLKHPSKLDKYLMIIFLKKILFEMYMKDSYSDYYVYLYNISILIRLLINKFLYINKIKKDYNINKIYLGVILKMDQMYKFIDVFTTLLLPIFETFNIYLNFKRFDFFGNLSYELLYNDPVFMSKNVVTYWNQKCLVSFRFCFNISFQQIDKYINILQYLRFNWYFKK